MKKKRLLIPAVITAAILASCTEKDGPYTQTPGADKTFILNNGTWRGNDSCITVYDPDTKTVTPGAFLNANGIGLGDLGQDILADRNRLYIAIYGSQVIFITDHDLKITGRITAEAGGNKLSPRSLIKAGGKIYVTYYEGYIGEIDPDSGTLVRTTAVGANPEGLAYADGKIYVANSGGMNYPSYSNTVSVVDADTFSETSRIEINANPSQVASDVDGKYIYVSSYGNYSDVPAKLQVIDTASGTVTDLPYSNVSGIASGPDSRLYILCGGYDADWNPLPGSIYVHDSSANLPYGSNASDSFAPTSFVTDGTVFPDAYSISATADGYVYVGCSDYQNTGDVYVMTSDGRLHDRFDAQGLNPIAVASAQ